MRGELRNEFSELQYEHFLGLLTTNLVLVLKSRKQQRNHCNRIMYAKELSSV